MDTFVVREYEETQHGRYLIPLTTLVERLGFIEVTWWAFRSVTLQGDLPFEMSVQEFERLTFKLEHGLIVGNRDFHAISNVAGFQLIDGDVDAYTSDCVGNPLFSIACQDTSFYEIKTSSAEIAAQLIARGFNRKKDDGQRSI